MVLPICLARALGLAARHSIPGRAFSQLQLQRRRRTAFRAFVIDVCVRRRRTMERPASALLGIALLAAVPEALGFSSAPIQVNPLDRNDVGALFNNYYQAARAVPPGWTGNAAGCVPGDTSAAFKQAQIGQINWNRAMAG